MFLRSRNCIDQFAAPQARHQRANRIAILDEKIKSRAELMSGNV
jgi:hypothetical protein